MDAGVKRKSSPQARARARARARALSLSAAVTLHAVVIGLVIYSLDGVPSPPLRQAGGQAIALGLTRVQADDDRSASLAALTGALGRGAGAEGQTPAHPVPADSASILAEMEASPGGAASQAAAKAPQATSGHARLVDASNPWTHTSIAAVDGAKARQLWSAAQRCWHGGVSFTPSEIRIVLDGAGAVTGMTWVGGGDAGARAQAEAVAAAITACAPYRAVAPNAGTYLVIGPLA